MKKLKKKDMKKVTGGFNSCASQCSAAVRSCRASGTPSGICGAEYMECIQSC